MLTAFNYYEPEEENRVRKEMKDSVLFDRELEIAEKFSQSKNFLKCEVKHTEKESGGGKTCPICKGNHTEFFYEKWGVEYLRCRVCYSVFADIVEEVEQEYKQLTDMINLRMSAEYQEKSSISRSVMWDELLDWMNFRTYRYIGRNRDLSVIDYGTRYQGLVHRLNQSGICGRYELKCSILNTKNNSVNGNKMSGQADVILCLDFIQHEINPINFLKEIKKDLKQDGLLFLSTRVGSGFDILTLRENNKNVFPYEHIMMPSKEGLKIMLEKAGFELLEITTPGTFDWNYVKGNSEGISDKEYFLRYFMDTATPNMEAEFQRFLQQSGMSSYAQAVARLK